MESSSTRNKNRLPERVTGLKLYVGQPEEFVVHEKKAFVHLHNMALFGPKEAADYGTQPCKSALSQKDSPYHGQIHLCLIISRIHALY